MQGAPFDLDALVTLVTWAVRPLYETGAPLSYTTIGADAETRVNATTVTFDAELPCGQDHFLASLWAAPALCIIDIMLAMLPCML